MKKEEEKDRCRNRKGTEVEGEEKLKEDTKDGKKEERH